MYPSPWLKMCPHSTKALWPPEQVLTLRIAVAFVKETKSQNPLEFIREKLQFEKL